MLFSINSSPLAGREGEYSSARLLKARVEREALADVALKVTSVGKSDSIFTVSGRGELHLSIFIEKMRREGYEFQVGKPEVIFHEMDGLKLEPFEDVHIECPEEFSGAVIEKLVRRKAEMREMKVERGIAYLHFLVSTRGLIGYRSEFLTDTKGEGIMDTLFHDYLPWQGELRATPHGSLIAFESGMRERGTLFIHAGTEVYEGMIVGQNAKAEDLMVNVCNTKKLTNMRSKGDGVVEHFDTPVTLSLEEAIEYLGDDELLEVTPKSLRIRKAILNKHERKRATV
jgi:GTP-binding protein